jgi:Tol biopolymer transport system component
MKKVLLVAVVCALAGASPVAAMRSSSIRYLMPAWSPDGKSIAFVGRGLGDLFVMNADGSGIRRLTNSSSGSTDYGARFPTWSPDSQKIAFGYGYDGICVINADGSGFHRISDTGVLPAWSPGGKKIAFVAIDDTSGGKIYVMKPDGSSTELIAQPSESRSFESLAWSPDGQLLAFGVSTAPDTDILPGYLGVVSRYQGRVRVFLRGYNPFPASWHGTKIAVAYDPITNDSDWPDHVRVGTFDMRTNTLKNLHRGDHPSFSPDGRRLVFRCQGNIWVINADGRGARRLTHS